MTEKMAITVILLSLMVAVTTMIRGLLEHLRRGRTERIQAEMYNKTLDKLTAGQDVLAYLQSEAGSKIFQAAQMAEKKLGQPQNRIMNAVQAGVVLGFVGAGFLTIRGYMSEAAAQEAFMVIGSIGVFAGLALVASGIAAWALAKKFGLMSGGEAEQD